MSARAAIACLLLVLLAGAAVGEIGAAAASKAQVGVASWYGPGFHGKRTANGEIYDKEGLTAAHKTLPFGTYLRVRSLDNGSSVVVRVNDRGPFVEGRIIDLSEAAARILGMIASGTARVSFEAIPKEEALAWKGANADGSIPRGGAVASEAPSAAPPPAVAGPSPVVRIQVASYSRQSNARSTVERLGLSGIKASIERWGPYYRVVIDGLETASARDLAQRLEALGYRGYLVTTTRP